MNERQPVQSKPANLDRIDDNLPREVSHISGAEETSSDTKSVSELTPEEQMALYEKELKENDWGHQPC